MIENDETRKRKAKALVIEDNSMWLKTITKLLKKEGYDVVQVDSKDVARDILGSDDERYQDFTLITLDLRLDEHKGGFEGMDLLGLTDRRWKEDGTSVIIITAYGWVEQAQEAFKNFPQVYDFIPKSEPGVDFYNYFLKIVREITREYFKSE